MKWLDRWRCRRKGHRLSDNGGEFGCMSISCVRCGVEIAWVNMFEPWTDSDEGIHASAHLANVWLQRKVSATRQEGEK